MNEELYEVALKLILDAGDAHTKAMLAIQAAREFRFSDTEELIAQGEACMRNAHETQTELLQAEARGEQPQLNLITVHAQDHLTMALMSLDNARESLHIYRMIRELKNN